MSPDNVLMGDVSTGIDLPETQLDENELFEEKKMAQYSKTAEFKRIQDYCQERIAFYQTKLPNGAEVGLDVAPSAEDWRVANRVIGELKLLMNIYETATQAVEQANGTV